MIMMCEDYCSVSIESIQQRQQDVLVFQLECIGCFDAVSQKECWVIKEKRA